MPDMNIPNRPAGQRPETALPPEPNHFHHANPWFMGGVPVANTWLGNFTFSGGLFPVPTCELSSSWIPWCNCLWSWHRAFHGGHAHGFPLQVHRGQRADVYLKALLVLGGKQSLYNTLFMLNLHLSIIRFHASDFVVALISASHSDTKQFNIVALLSSVANHRGNVLTLENSLSVDKKRIKINNRHIYRI